MAVVMIVCPKTGKYVSTGIEMDAETFRTCSFMDNSITCPRCGQSHVWSSGDARLIEQVSHEGD